MRAFSWAHIGSIGCVLFLGSAGCQEARHRTPPSEVPIQEYRVEGPAPEQAADSKDDGGAGTSTTSASTKSGDDAPSTAPKLDAKNGFAGVQLGASFKSFKGLKQTEKSGDHVTYKARNAPSYGTVALKDVYYTFNKGKLDTITFSVKSNSDCRGVKESFERDFGTPQATSSQGAVWKGEKVGLRFVIAATSSCSGTVVSKELGDAASWSALQP